MPPTDLQQLLAEEPFVRALATQLLVDEPDDLVQQTYLRAVQHRPDTAGRPRSWLARVVRNLAIDQRRQRRRRADRERRAALAERLPSAAALVELEERRLALVTAVNALPTSLRTLVLLRYYESLPPRRIAAQLDLPVAVVWERLRQALERLRTRLDARHGDDRRAWLLPLVPLSVRPRPLPWRELMASENTWTGVLAMTTKSKFAIVAVVLVLLAGVWAAWPRSQPTPPAAAGAREVAAASTQPEPAEASTLVTAPEREAVDTPASVPATTGSLLARVRYSHEPRAAADVPVLLHRPGGDFRVDVLHARTDAVGEVQFDAVPAGNWVVTTGRSLGPKAIEIFAGQQHECVLDLKGGMDVSGTVVDASGTPVAGALVEVGEQRSRDPEVVATSAADGTFTLRACPFLCLIGARAAGYASSSLVSVRARQDGAPQHVRLELVAPGGMVEGIVTNTRGTPVADAVVRVGEGQTDNLKGFVGLNPPLPAQVRTDADGNFRAIGVPVGTQNVQVRAVGFAPWRGSCEVGANLTVPLRATLGMGGSCAGTVVDAEGTPVADITVQVGDKGDFVQLFARTVTDGTFELRDLPIGEVELTAADDKLGMATAKVVTALYHTAHCELRLAGQELRGRVVDEADAPVAWTPLKVTVEGGDSKGKIAMTDDKGSFRVPLLPEGCRVAIELIKNRTFGEVRRTGVDPASGEYVMRLQREPRSARIRGVVLDADGRPGTEVTVLAPGHAAVVTATDGSFELGPLPSGAVWIYFEKEGCAAYRSARFTLTDNATLDLGTVHLHRGGTVRVEITGAPASELAIAAQGISGEGVVGTGIVATTVPIRSIPLNPGSYELRVQGKGFAPQRLPFTIRDGEETTVSVTVAPGVAQGFEFQVPTGDAAPESVAFEVRQGDTVVWSAAAWKAKGFAVDAWFAPGDYELVVTQQGRQGTAHFTVGKEPGPPVVVPVH